MIRRWSFRRRELAAEGVRGDRLVTVGRGATEPRAGNDTAAGRAADRRVEMVMTRPKVHQ